MRGTITPGKSGVTGIRFALVAAALLGLLVAQVAGAVGASADQQAASSVVTDAKFKKLKNRVAALEAKPDQVGPAIPASLPPSGTAGGELAGTYPNPTIGTVAGLDVATSTSSTAGINFGPDVGLFRSAANTLEVTSPDTLKASSIVVNNGLTVNPGLIFMGETSGIILNFANTASFFARDNGANKTQLVVKWPSGTETVLATEP